MVKGASINFKSYSITLPKFLEILKFDQELKKYDKVVIKPNLNYLKDDDKERFLLFTDALLDFCQKNKNPVSEIYLAEGADGEETSHLFEKTGFSKIADKYSIGLIDLNNSEVKEIHKPGFLKFDKIYFPQILLDSFLISITPLSVDPELEVSASLTNMLGAFPAQYYKGLFSSEKKKIKRWPIRYAIHDISLCKTPDFSIIDASLYGKIFAGQSLEIDKQATHLLDKDPKDIPYLKLLDK
jgi:uncharacterized protein (DUF362 family)